MVRLFKEVLMHIKDSSKIIYYLKLTCSRDSRFTSYCYNLLRQTKMNCYIILIAVNALLLLRSAGAVPVIGGTTVVVHSADNASNESSSLQPSNPDTINHYCLYPPLNSPSIIDLYIELNTVIDVLEAACTNHTFKQNVSLWYIAIY